MIPRMLFLSLTWAAVLAQASSTFAAETPADLALQARTILKKHCAECHDGQTESRSTLVLLDHVQLTDKRVGLPAFVTPKAVATSQIVHFMEEGSMPPGDRAKVSAPDIAIIKAWIESGANEFPRRFDENYALSKIAADLKKAAEGDRKFYRYFSLHHLPDEAGKGIDLAKQRDDFRKALSLTAKKDVEALTAIDASNTLFRVDLRELGWNTAQFRLLDREGKNLPSPFSTFDLLLLEYPFAEMPPATADAEQIAELWLRPFEQVRPIIYLRADWFTKAVENPGLKSDLARLLGGAAKGRGFNAPDKRGPDIRFDRLPSIELRPLAKSVPIIPIDAWYLGDYDPKPPAPKIEIKITDAAGKASEKFKPGERMKFEIKSNETVFIELIHIDPEGSIFAHDLGPNFRVQANNPKEVEFEGKKDGLLLSDEVGRQRFIIFAAVDKFAPGDLLQSAGEGLPIERYVHRFYELPRKLGDPLRFDPSRMVRKTAGIEVAK